MRRLVIVAALTVAQVAEAQPAGPPPPGGGDSAEARCTAVVASRGLPMPAAAAGHSCSYLALHVVDRVRTTARQRAIRGRLSQPVITDTPGAQASIGQTAAVASGQPVATTGGSVAVADETGQGLQLVTALAINPASLALGDTETRSMWTSRLLDLSIVLPLNVDPAEGARRGFRYVGGRLRANVFPALEREGLERAAASFRGVLTEASISIPAITALLAAAESPEACAAAIEVQDETAQLSQCGAAINLGGLATLTSTATRALAEIREQADRKYLSIEGRIDRGDLDGDDAEDNDSLMAVYLAGGYTFYPTARGSTFALRARAGAVSYRDGMTGTSSSALYGALGVELAMIRDLQRYTLSVAAELVDRRGDGAEAPMLDPALENHIRIGVGLPLADGKVVSIGVAIPTDGGDPTIALSGDWSLLVDAFMPR